MSEQQPSWMVSIGMNLISAAIGGVLTIVIQSVGRFLRKCRQSRQLSRAVEEYRKIPDVHVIHYGTPYLSKQHTKVTHSEKTLILEFPEAIRREIRRVEKEKELDDEKHRLAINDPQTPDGGYELSCLQEAWQIPELSALIAAKSKEVAQKFLDRLNRWNPSSDPDGCLFNNRTYGVAGINCDQRTQDTLEAQLTDLKVFETDYFTSRVLSSIYREISAICNG